MSCDIDKRSEVFRDLYNWLNLPPLFHNAKHDGYHFLSANIIFNHPSKSEWFCIDEAWPVWEQSPWTAPGARITHNTPSSLVFRTNRTYMCIAEFFYRGSHQSGTDFSASIRIGRVRGQYDGCLGNRQNLHDSDKIAVHLCYLDFKWKLIKIYFLHLIKEQ